MKRVARIGLMVLGCIVAVAALAVGTTMLLLRTSWGGERLRRMVVSRVNEQIQGHFDIARLTFGGDRLALRGVELRDPAGRLVADVAGIDVAFSVARLVRKEIRVTALHIDTPQLGLLSDAGGTNLTRATAPRREGPTRPPSPPRQKTASEGWVVNVKSIVIDRGDVAVGVTPPGSSKGTDPRLHLAALHFAGNVRYALGNGSLDLAARLDGESRVAPLGPLGLTATAQIRGDDLRAEIDGRLLGGSIHVHTTMRGTHIENASGAVALELPAFSLAGHTWGPLHVVGATQPGVPAVDIGLALPGVAFDGKGGGSDEFTFDGKLTLNDLAVTTRAVADLTGRELPPIAGRGHLAVWCGGKMSNAPLSWSGRAKGAVERLRIGENTIDDVTLEARTAHVAKSPELADLEIHVASIRAGTTKLGAIALSVAVRGQALSAKASVASPEAVELTLTGTLDTEPHSLALTFFTLQLPDARWSTEGTAHIGYGERLSLSAFRLRSEGQTIAIDAAKTGDFIDARLAVQNLRLALLPRMLVDPSLHLGGMIAADVRADGTVAEPHVVARVDLEGGRARNWSRVDANLRATLAGGQVNGTTKVEAPFASLDAAFQLPVAVATPGAPLDVRLDIARLDLGELMRGVTAKAAPVDGRMTLHLELTGTADQPKLSCEAKASGLKVLAPPPSSAAVAAARKASGTTSAGDVDLGQASLRLNYAERAAHANLTFSAARGGSLRVDASIAADLGYPRVLQGPPLSKRPMHGQVVAKDLDVAWVRQLNPRVEALGGQVSANAKLTGTLADPQFIGDVRWKDGGATLVRPSADVPQGRRPPTSAVVESRGRVVE